MSRLILASESPQRRAILGALGVKFEVVAPGVEEVEVGDPEAVAIENARRKALAVEAPGATIIGCDTLVALGGEIFGKPDDEAQARVYLAALAGRAHQVHSGLAVARDGRVRVAHVVTQVVFGAIEEQMLDWYIGTGEWRGRAGGCDIQGAGGVLVERIDGDYLNVVGLPTRALLELEPGLLHDHAG
ncbi:MAG TPA: Maf family protein [Baekduia sp.]|nr:Maf family protein [Baekduia sp.]